MTDPTSRMPLPGEPVGPGEDPDPTAATPIPSPPQPTPPSTSETGTFGAQPGAASPAPQPVPAPPPPPPAGDWRPPRTDEGRFATIVFGLILLGLGLWFFAEITLGLELPTISWDQVWPIILIVIGLWVILASRRRTSG